jgi:hypothetical protein
MLLTSRETTEPRESWLDFCFGFATDGCAYIWERGLAWLPVHDTRSMFNPCCSACELAPQVGLSAGELLVVWSRLPP